MPDAWTGDLVGRMHNAEVTLNDLAKEIGWSTGYISMILNGSRRPVGAMEKLNAAFYTITARRLAPDDKGSG